MIAIKLGTRSIVSEDGNVHQGHIRKQAQSIEEIALSQEGIFIVSSGAIALGSLALGNDFDKQRYDSKDPIYRAYLASFGQPKLMEIYREAFNMHVAQMLVTNSDLGQPNHISNLIYETLKQRSMMIVNYNDGVDAEQVNKNNDETTIELMKHCIMHPPSYLADLPPTHSLSSEKPYRVVIFGEEYDGVERRTNPKKSGELIRDIALAEIPDILQFCSGAGSGGTGGMRGKIEAVQNYLQFAQNHGKQAEVYIAHVRHMAKDVLSGNAPCTRLYIP